MAINPSSFASQDIQHSTVFAIEILTQQPVAGAQLATPKVPGQLLAWFNGSTGAFELYIANGAGLRLYKVVS